MANKTTHFECNCWTNASHQRYERCDATHMANSIRLTHCTHTHEADGIRKFTACDENEMTASDEDFFLLKCWPKRTNSRGNACKGHGDSKKERKKLSIIVDRWQMKEILGCSATNNLLTQMHHKVMLCETFGSKRWRLRIRNVEQSTRKKRVAVCRCCCCCDWEKSRVNAKQTIILLYCQIIMYMICWAVWLLRSFTHCVCVQLQTEVVEFPVAFKMSGKLPNKRIKTK